MQKSLVVIAILFLIFYFTTPQKSEQHLNKNEKAYNHQLLFRRFENLGISNLLQEERDYLLIWSLDVEVCNGSFDQYFFNDSGNHAKETLSALQLCNAQQTYDITFKAIQQFEPVGGYSADRKQRQQKMDTLRLNVEMPFEKITQEFHNMNEQFRYLALKRVYYAYQKNHIPTE